MWQNKKLSNPLMLKFLNFNREIGISLLSFLNTHTIRINTESAFHTSRNGHNSQNVTSNRNLTKDNDKQETSSLRPKLDFQRHLKSVNPKFFEIYYNKCNYLQRTDKFGLTVADPHTARNFAELIADDVLKHKGIVAEANPGMGLLTVELLRIGIPLIHVFETNEVFYQIMAQMQEQYPGQIMLHKLTIIEAWHLLAKNVHSTSITTALANNETLQIIGATTGTFFKTFPYILNKIDGALFDAEVYFYLAVLPQDYAKLTTGVREPYYSKRSVLFQTLYESKLLGKIERKGFVPWQRRPNTLKLQQDHEYDVLHVIKVKTKGKQLKQQLTEKDLAVFHHFITNFFASQQKRLIPSIETWIPGCGPRLIAKGYNIFTRFAELYPDEIFNLFIEITKWPEREKRHFVTDKEEVENTDCDSDKDSYNISK